MNIVSQISEAIALFKRKDIVETRSPKFIYIGDRQLLQLREYAIEHDAPDLLYKSKKINGIPVVHVNSLDHLDIS